MVEGDLIFALASGAGRAAVAILRLSGAGCGQVLQRLAGPLPPPRHAILRSLRDADGLLLDRALVLWFPAPGSYTGENSGELHLHGSPAGLQAVSEALLALGARPAEAGEFTRRAFLNDRMDLLQAEGLADLIAAETAAQRQQALRQMEGVLSRIYDDWTGRLRRMLAHQEALIDFPDEDLPAAVEQDMVAGLASLQGEIELHLADGHRGEKLRDGLILAVTGAPNVGKSSLVNALAARDVAIVSPWAGTTRDALEVRLDLDGVPVTLVDTAGLRDTADPIEAEGVRRARVRAEQADLTIDLIEAGDRDPPVPAGAALRVANKIDLAPAPPGYLGISILTGAGLPELRAVLVDRIQALTRLGGPPPLTRIRHRAALEAASRWLAAAESASLPELRAEDLRLALREIGRITGHVGVEDLLDTVFSSFCIGK